MIEYGQHLGFGYQSMNVSCTSDSMEPETKTVHFEIVLDTKTGFIKIKSDFVNAVTVKEINFRFLSISNQ